MFCESPIPSVSGLSPTLASFLERSTLPTPFLVVDGAVVSQKLNDLRCALPDAELFYAMKANPLPGVLSLVANGHVEERERDFRLEAAITAMSKPNGAHAAFADRSLQSVIADLPAFP